MRCVLNGIVQSHAHRDTTLTQMLHSHQTYWNNGQLQMSDQFESDFSYEDELSLEISNEDVSLVDSDLGSECSSQSLANTALRTLPREESQRPFKSSNPLSSASYRSLGISWYIYQYFLLPCEELKRNVLPEFTLEELVMLSHFKKWSIDEVTSDYFDNWPKLRDSCGLGDIRGVSHLIREEKRFTCPVCCESEDLEVFCLSCGHTYCTDCYKRYILVNLSRGSLIRCMESSCNLSLLYSDVEKLLKVKLKDEVIESTGSSTLPRKGTMSSLVSEDAEADIAVDTDNLDEYDQQFENIDDREYRSSTESADPLLKNPLLVNAARVNIAMSRSKYKWCPSIDCSELVEYIGGSTPQTEQECDLSKVKIVTCGKSHEFCFDCQRENHLPCPCWITASWIKRCEDDSETVNWIDANTQSCPQCHAVIEKSGGCNHMICGKCKNEFCWICFGDWAAHKSSWWQCNRYDPKEVEELKKKRSNKQNSLSRYLHFYRRFSVHQVSMEGDKKTLQMVRRCMLQYMKAQTLNNEKAISWNDVQFLADAIKSLSSGRKTLMWTYAFAFYLKKTNFSEIFEGMQDYLNKTVEDLSRLFEEIKKSDAPEKTTAKIRSKKTEIVSLASLVTRRRDMLIECAYNGLRQGTLQFYSP